MAEPRPVGPALTEARRLDPRMRQVWAIQVGLSGGVLVVAGLVAAVVAGVHALLPLALVPVVAFAAWWWPRAVYEHYSYVLEPATLELRSGVFWRSQVTVPYFRMQNVDISQGPIERRLGLAELRLKTAAPAASVSLPGIPFEDAEDLRRTILDRAGGDDTVV